MKKESLKSIRDRNIEQTIAEVHKTGQLISGERRFKVGDLIRVTGPSDFPFEMNLHVVTSTHRSRTMALTETIVAAPGAKRSDRMRLYGYINCAGFDIGYGSRAQGELLVYCEVVNLVEEVQKHLDRQLADIDKSNEHLIEMLWPYMRKDREHADRVHTGWGTKTKVGLCASIKRIVAEGGAR